MPHIYKITIYNYYYLICTTEIKDDGERHLSFSLFVEKMLHHLKHFLPVHLLYWKRGGLRQSTFKQWGAIKESG